MTRPPRWIEEEEVIKRVSEEIAEMHRLAYVAQAQSCRAHRSGPTPRSP